MQYIGHRVGRRLLVLAIAAACAVPISLTATAGVAEAATTVISDEASCRAAGALWDPSVEQCNFYSAVTVGAGDVLETRVFVAFSGALTVQGTLVLTDGGVAGGVVTNNGVIDIVERRFRPRNVMHNHGTINISAAGMVEPFPDNSILNNHGTINVNAGGTLNNLGTVNNSATIRVACGGSVVGNPVQGNQPQLADCSPPVIMPVVTGTLGSNGWYVSGVSVAWAVSDSQSTITARSGCDPVTINADTAGVTVTCTATSGGGTASQSVTIKRDATAPTITAAATTADGRPYTVGNVTGQPVTVTFTCSDTTSGVATCAGPQAYTSDGVYTASGTATDLAGNSASTELGPIRIQSVPEICLTTPGAIVGTPGPDTLTGTAGRDVICGLAGSDTINGLAEVDLILPGSGDDVVDGGSGNDAIQELSGNDTLRGGSGDDNIDGGLGNDLLLGGSGSDTAFGGPGNDRLFGEAGNDPNLNAVDGISANDSVDGGSGTNSCTADPGEAMARCA